MNKDLIAIFEYMEREKGIKREIIAEAIEESLLLAARKSVGDIPDVEVKLDPKLGTIEIIAQKEVVVSVVAPQDQISLKEAQKHIPDAFVGQMLSVSVTPRDFGRIAAQKARQVIGSKLKMAERDVIYAEYRDRTNEIVSGSVKRFARGADLIVDLGKVEALMPMREYPKIENYQIGDRVVALLKEVQDTATGGAEVILSRSCAEFVKQLLSAEVPEIGEDQVAIEKICRDAGYRTKIVVRSHDGRIDPVGACIGMRGSRIKAIIRELNNEKIDVIAFNSNSVQLLQNLLDPIIIKKIQVDEENAEVEIVVDDENYAVVLGKRGSNARLCGEVLGVHLIVQKMSTYQKKVLAERRELTLLESPEIDEPVRLDGINRLIMDNLCEAGFDTYRKLIAAMPEDLAATPGVSLDLADRILEQTTDKVRNFGKEPQA